jgi:hypothetical protein
MKKILVAILALLYITTSIGAPVHLHYCMGKFDSWGFGHSKSKTCDKCGMEPSEKRDSGCCKDEQKFIKNDTDQKAPKTAFQMSGVMAVAVPVSFFEIPPDATTVVRGKNPISHAPPNGDSLAVYIRNRVFLI